jgi:two-component system sensor histidine kinase VicK
LPEGKQIATGNRCSTKKYYMNIDPDDMLKRLGDVSVEGYFVIDFSKQEIIYLNDAFKSISGLRIPNTKPVVELLKEMIHPEDESYVTDYFSLLKKGVKVKTEFRILKQGENRYVCVNAYPIAPNEGLIAGYVTDITDLKNNIFYTEKINARKNAMLGVLAHDLKEPVAIINLVASVIKNNEAVIGNTAILNNIQIIQDLCDRNIALIKDLMKEEFLEAPEVGIKKERSDMVKAMAEIVKQYQNSEHVLEREFVFVAPAHPIYAMVDMLKIGQSINNLIVNAMKFTEVGGRIEIQLTDEEETVMLAVSDNGIGIPEELKPFIFEKRTRAHRKGLRGEEGSGIGLSIIRSLIEGHGGRIWMQSQEGAGSTFYLQLPKGL